MPLFGLIAFAFLIYFLPRFFSLVGQVKALEERVKALAARLPAATGEPGQPTAPVVPAVAVPSTPPVAVTPPSLPPKPVRIVETSPPAVVPPDPAFERLRDLGLLPPAELKGEYALGAWWAVRVGGVLAVAAVVFLGIWLNLRSAIPPIVRILEVALVGAGLFWGGLRLSVKRADLGQVVAASGLAVWQFAAWATYGLDKMRLFEDAGAAALVQFLVAALIAAIALWKGNKLFGQLAVLFATLAVFFSIGAGAAPVPTATGAGLVALLGVVLMVRGPWGSAGVLGLIGSQVALLFLYNAMPTKDANYLPLQLAALGSFLVLWVGERLLKDDAVLSGADMRAAFQLGSFFAPACLSLFLATGDENERATVSLLIAGIASVAALMERGRRRLVFELLSMAAVGFAGAGLAWLVDSHLVWLIWAIAAAGTVMVGTRTRSELLRWSAEALAAVAVFTFICHPPQKPWMALAGIVVLGLILSFREDWERTSDAQKLRRALGILGVGIAVLAVQHQFAKADTGWPWLVLLLVAVVRFRPALLWAALPGYLYTCGLVVFRLGMPVSWSAFWAAQIVLINSIALWRLIGREGSGAKVLRQGLSFLTAALVFAFAHSAMSYCFPQASPAENPSAWIPTLAWASAGLLLVALTCALRRLGAVSADLSLFAAGAFIGYVLQLVQGGGYELRGIGLAQSPFILLGLGCLLQTLAIHTREQGTWGTVQRAVLGSATLFLVTFVMLSRLPGAGVSLFWALASVLTFVIGHLLSTRSLRMVGLLGLMVASVRVLSHDITDLLGRIAACAALAIAFFGIAWLYGRIKADGKDA
jgi:hypothetical protein